MNDTLWLRAAECSLLQAHAEVEDVALLRRVQRLLELTLRQQRPDELAHQALREIADALGADPIAILDTDSSWRIRWQYARIGTGWTEHQLPRGLLGEVLDREAGACQTATDRSFVAVLVGENRILLAQRSRDAFSMDDLAYAVAAGHYFGQAILRAWQWEARLELEERLQALVAIGQQLVEERETIPLLEHIAAQAARLLRCERATIFLRDKSRQELVGRPALGLPGGELRLADHVGVVGKVVHTGQVMQVDDVQLDSSWHGQIDASTGFVTRNLLCVPLTDAAGERAGALEVLNKTPGTFNPQDVETLQALARQITAALENVRERETLLRASAQFEGQARAGCQIVGQSTAIVALRGMLERLAGTDLPVLILGESGTGKDVVARAIHYQSPRRQHPFIPVNCAAIAESLLESELFGHEKGAFTDAQTTHTGKFEAASGGTLFLDEIGDLSAGGQAKLLRVLEEKIVFRVGGTRPIPVDTRVIAATNRNLSEAVRARKFREDLFYRLTVVTLDLPPLRDRRDDILVLADHFLDQFSRAAGRRSLKLSAEARKRLAQHDWPGNVRELRNLLERVAYLCPGPRVEANDLAFILRPASGEPDRHGELILSEATDAFQRDHIQHAIDRAGRNMSEAAKLLGLHRPNLYRKMKMLGMETE
jgi:transcriptional regulator with GAF, ATPase, and Fis domain